jgi:hypothetical protein
MGVRRAARGGRVGRLTARRIAGVTLLVAAPLVAASVSAASAQHATGRSARSASPTISAQGIGEAPTSILNVACGSPTSCTAIIGSRDGDVPQGSGTETNGTWALAGLTPPTGGWGISFPMTCTGPADCVVMSGGNVNEAVSEVDGVWGAWQSLPTSDVLPSAVSCTDPGDCTAVGVEAGLFAAAGYYTEDAGVWGSEAGLPLPADAHPDTVNSGQTDLGLNSIDCVSGGDCVAVGLYDLNAPSFNALIETETNGVWSANGVELPANALTTTTGDRRGDVEEASLGVVSCPVFGGCVAVGWYWTVHDGVEPMAVAQHGGVWGRAVELQLPPGASTTKQHPFLNAVGCAGPESCVVVGAYTPSHGTKAFDAMVVPYLAGTWRRASRVPLPPGADADTRTQHASLYGVDCTAGGSCGAFGRYDNAHGRGQLMVVTLRPEH